jgi:hypothetical protein
VVVASSKALTFHDLAAGKPFAERKAPEPETDGPGYAFIRAVRHFPDGKRLVTGESDTTALVWEVPARPKSARELTERERTAAWANLASADGAKGWAAVWALADDPGAVENLRARVKPVRPLTGKEFDQLLSDLGSDDFPTREAATASLRKAGERPVGQLRAALKTELNAEQRFRAERLLAGWEEGERKKPAGERLRVMRAVAALELAGTANARKLLSELAGGVADATTTREAQETLQRTGRK